jgi:DNA adenine methylase
MTPPTRPVLRYHGGKWKLAPWILGFFPKHRVYVEPFGGAASVLLRKPRSYAEVYNDLDGEIVSLFRVCRDRGEELRLALELTPFSRTEFLGSYETAGDPVEQARRTLVRSNMGFGSAAASGAKTGFRANSNRSHMTPALDWKNYPAILTQIIERLQGVVLETGEADKIMEQHDGRETLHYVDPPYPHSTRSIGNPYCKKGYRHEMNDEQHRQLATTLRDLTGMVVLSGYPCDLYDSELYSDWTRHERQAHADGARKRTEVLWLNPACSEALNNRGLFGGAA